MALITDQDLATFLGQPSLVGDARAQMVTALASALVADYLQNTALGLSTTHTDVILDGPARGSSVFLIPGFPVSGVSKVETRCDTTWTTLTYATDYQWNSAGFVSRTRIADATSWGRWWPREIASIRISYTSGFASIPDSVRAIALGIAARGFTNPIGVLSEQIGDYQYSSGAAHASWMQLDPAELSILSGYSDWPVG